MQNQDIIFLALGCVSAGFFAVLGPEKLFKFYIGIILGFLLFIIANLQIKLLALNPGTVIGGGEDFLIKNKDFVLGFCATMMPLLGIFLGLNENISLQVKGGVLIALTFGLILPFFLLGLYIYIVTTTAVPLSFLTDILGLLSAGQIYAYTQSHLQYVFYFLLFFIFYKIILTFFFAMFTKIYEKFNESIGQGGGNHSGGHGEDNDHGHGGGHDEHHGGHDDHGHDNSHGHH